MIWLVNLLLCGFVYVDRNLYTIRAVSFTDVRSIHRWTPTFGWQYIIVVLSSGMCVCVCVCVYSFIEGYVIK